MWKYSIKKKEQAATSGSVSRDEGSKTNKPKVPGLGHLGRAKML